MYRLRTGHQVEVICFKRDKDNPHIEQLVQIVNDMRYFALRPLEWDTDYDDFKHTEEDDYDNEEAINFLSLVDGIPLSYIRLNRTDRDFISKKGIKRSYMLRDVFADRAYPERYLLDPRERHPYVPRSPEIREMSRLVVDRILMKDCYNRDNYPEQRRFAVTAVGAAMAQYCRNPLLEPGAKPIKEIVGVMYPTTWDTVWRERGFHPKFMAPKVDLNAAARSNFDPKSGLPMPKEEFVIAGSLPMTDTSINRILYKADVQDPRNAVRAYRPPRDSKHCQKIAGDHRLHLIPGI